MEVHDRFMKLATTGVSIIETLASNREKESSLILELLEAYKKKITSDVFDTKTLETFRMILCYKYQSLVNTRNSDDLLEASCRLYPDLGSIFTKNNENRTREEQSMLYDIAVLQLALYSIKEWLLMSIVDFYETERSHPDKESKNLDMKVLESFADACILQTHLGKSKDSLEKLEGPLTCILAIINSWMQQEDDIQWKLLASLLPKLAIIFGAQKIVPSLWQLVFGALKIESDFRCKVSIETIDLDKKLAVLCVLADACFPSETGRAQEFHYEQSVQNEFWFIVNQGLVSLAPQQRKQSLYLIKRAIEFIETHKAEVTKKLGEKNNVPFLCSQPEAQLVPLEEAKKNFFLILEVLEEKQKHLVLPALSYLPSLARIHPHEVCCTCLSPVWLSCILRRVVQHDNESVKIFGLQQILKSDHSIFFDETFVSFFVAEFNNTFLYEYNVGAEDMPKIVDKLKDFFVGLLHENEDLMTTIVGSISSVAWGPVPIYWILKALLAAFQQSKINRNECKFLPFLEKLIRKSLMRHNLRLRISSQVLLTRVLREMPLYPSYLQSILDILTSFPRNGYVEPYSREWRNVAKYLSNNIDSLSAQEYIVRRCEKLSDADQTSRCIALLMESGLIFAQKPCRAETALHNLLQNLVGADLRPYANRDTIMKALNLSGCLMFISGNYKNTASNKITELMATYVDYVIKIVNRSLERNTILAYDEYSNVIAGLISSRQCPEWPNVQKELERFEDKCIHIIGNPNNFSRSQWSYAIKVLCLCRRETMTRPELGKVYVPPLLRYFRNEVLDQTQREQATEKNNEPEDNFATHCFETVASLVHELIASRPLDEWPPKIHWFQELQALAETGDENVIYPVARTVQELLQKIPVLSVLDLDTVNSIIRVSWRNLWELKKTSVFFDALEKLICLIVSNDFLKTAGAEEFAVECVDQIMKEGESVPMLKKIFLIAIESLGPGTYYLLHFRKAFTSCLLHGIVPRRDQRIELGAIEHSQRFDDLDCFSSSDVSIDNTIRADAISILVEKIKLKHAAEFGEEICNDLLEILEKHKNKRYFDNSQLHRLKHRIMQTMLVLHPILKQTSQENLHDSLCDLLIAESNQPSVRLMYEWLLIRLHVANPDMRESIWTLFETAVEKRPGCVVSLASVIFHVARLLPEPTRTEYIGKAIPILLPNCMGQQFNVRLYSQTILVEIYEMLPEGSTKAETYRVIYEVTQKSICRGNLMKNSSKVLDDFYFSVFNPELDYNIRTIYWDLPRLTNVAFDEWIRPEVFTIVGVEPLVTDREGVASLSAAKPSEQSPRATGDLAATSVDVELDDIQKKIIPWKTMVPFYDDLSEISKAKLLRRKMQNEETGIIVVASLIDRPPNLGGLARTCEIFGAKELVIGSLRYAEDREFQTLSVSAEKWITITEVKPHLLQNYLLEKQSEGWELVGAEQTAKSTNLLEMVFPKKTILVLGNEKDGIPANLIPLLDTCVEIPQNGVVRSLNVHVTGAICIWQYAKQHVLT